MPDISDLQGPYHRHNRCSIICFSTTSCASASKAKAALPDSARGSSRAWTPAWNCCWRPGALLQLFKMKAYQHGIDQQQCSPSVSREHKSHEQTAQEDGIVNQPPHSHVIARFLGPKFDVVAQPFCSASSASFSADSEFRRAFARRSHLNPKHLQQMRRCVHCTPIPLHLCQALVNAPHLLEGLGASKLL